MAGDIPSRSWHPLRQAQLLPQVPPASSQNQGRVTDGNEAGAVSMAAADPVFIHSGEKLQDVPFLEAQVPVGGARVVTQRPDCPASQTSSPSRGWSPHPGTPRTLRGSHSTRGEGIGLNQRPPQAEVSPEEGSVQGAT